MWCRRRLIGRQRRPSRSNGNCIRRRRWWRYRAGQRFRNLCCRHLRRFPPRRLSDLDWHTTDLGARTARRGRGVPLPPAALWPRQTALPPVGALATLPVPAANLFKIPESARVTMLAASPRRATLTAQARSTEVSSAKLAGKSRRHAQAAAAQPSASVGDAAHTPQSADAPPPKPAAQAKRNGRSVRVAGLKKR